MKITFCLLISAFLFLSFRQKEKTFESLLSIIFSELDLSKDSLIRSAMSIEKYEVGKSVHHLGINGKDYYIGEFSNGQILMEKGINNELAIIPSECGQYNDLALSLSVTMNYKERKKCKKQFKFLKKLFETHELKLFDKIKFKDKNEKGIRYYYSIQEKDWDFLYIIKKEFNTNLKDDFFSLSVVLEKKC